MKKIHILFLSVLLIMSLITQSAFAADYISVYGVVSDTSKGITIVTLDKDADIENVVGSDIKYIQQVTPISDGNFKLVLPLGNSEDFIIRSNMDVKAYDGEEKGTVYVSSNGSDSNDGMTESTPFETLDKAYDNLFHAKQIVILDSAEYNEPPEHSGNLTIKGKTSDVILNLPGEISLKGDLELDNLTIDGASTVYANGYSFKVGEAVDSTATLSTGRLIVYGGKKSTDLTGDTDLILLGGKYQTIFGGGYGGVVDGNTNVIIGGSANVGDGINDQDTSTISPCYVYGGGNNAAVTGKTNVTLQGNAVAKYIVGAGNGADGIAIDTNIFISGGKVMNVYGGSLTAELANCNTHITMTGGLAEALFGGSYIKQLTGNTYITLLGGIISRRVYSGCYNNVGFSWDSSYHVAGTTSLAIGPDAQLVTYTELDSKNKLDCGIYSGSRVSQNYSEEVNTLIYLDDSYNAHNSKIGCIINGGIRSLNSWHDYVVKATVGGVVENTQIGGTIKVIPNAGYVGKVGSQTFETEGTVNIKSDNTTVVEFTAKPYNINSITANITENSVKGIADIMGSQNETNPKLWIVVYEEAQNRLIDCVVQDASVSGNKEFVLDCVFKEGKKYILMAYLWNGNFEPLSTCYSIDLR